MTNTGTEFWQSPTNKVFHQLMRSRKLENSPVLHGSGETASTVTRTYRSFAFFQKSLFALVLFIYTALLGVKISETIELKERHTQVSFISVASLSVLLAGRFFWALSTSWGNCFGGRIDAISRRLAEFVVCALLLEGFFLPTRPIWRLRPERCRRLTADLHPSYHYNNFINKQSKQAYQERL